MHTQCKLWVCKSDCAASVVAGYCNVAVQRKQCMRAIQCFIGCTTLASASVNCGRTIRLCYNCGCSVIVG